MWAFCDIELKSSLPVSKAFPNELVSIGDHLRAWRVENSLLQVDVARILAVCEDTITGWELNRNIPSIHQIPQIINLLGYIPIEIDTSTFGGRIAMYRYKNGLTPKKLGLLLSVDASTVRAWERNKNIPHKNRIKDIEETLLIV